MSVVAAIIPARGGSKGVPHKNLRPVGGVPLIVRAVRAAQAAPSLDLVVVSTDDEGIAAAAACAGARIVRRPAELAGDSATSESAVLHALNVLAESGVEVSTVAFLQATSPFIPSEGIEDAVADVRTGRFDSVFSAYQTYGFLWQRTDAGEAVGINHSASHRPRRQDREPHYLETGAFYVFDAAGFRTTGHRFFGRIGIVPVPERTAIEIDDLDQLAAASALAPLLDAPVAIPVRAVVTDFDGVHTDDTALVDQDGRELVRVSRSDGMGARLLREAGIPLVILSAETNAVVRARGQKLHAHVIHGVDDKAAALRDWAQQTGVDLAACAYLGNDVNDLPAMALVGWPVAVADARAEVRATARVVLSNPGGSGAVRELADRVLAGRAPGGPAPGDRAPGD